MISILLATTIEYSISSYRAANPLSANQICKFYSQNYPNVIMYWTEFDGTDSNGEAWYTCWIEQQVDIRYM